MPITSVPGRLVAEYFQLVHHREPTAREVAEAASELEARCASALFCRMQENGYELYRMAGSGRTHPRLRLLVRHGELAQILPEHSGRRKRG
jgi:hypothetical protein